MRKRRFSSILPFVLVLVFAVAAIAALSSDNYRIPSSVISSGGTSIESANCQMTSIFGQSSAIGQSSSSSYTNYAGFWHPSEVSFDGDTYTFNVGWNLITLSRESNPAYTAATLLQEINASGGTVTKVQDWDGGGWQTYSVGAPFGDFDIDMGKGYFLLADSDSEWVNTGIEPVCMETYSCASGWNLFGFPLAGPHTASSLAEEINASGGTVTKVQRWDGSGWRTYSVGAPFGDFAIGEEEGCFLLATSASTFDMCLFKVSNVRDTQFSVSWASSSAEQGSVNYGTDTLLGQTAYDDRGQVVSFAHHVTVSGLQPETEYYYEVVSGASTFDNGGSYFKVTTGPSIIPSGSVQPAGQVFLSDGITPAEGALVYVTIKDTDGLGSLGKSALESVLVDSSGYWFLELVNARALGYQSLFDFTEDVDQLLVTVDGGPEGKGQLETPATDFSDSLRPDITLE